MILHKKVYLRYDEVIILNHGTWCIEKRSNESYITYINLNGIPKTKKEIDTYVERLHKEFKVIDPQYAIECFVKDFL